MQTVRPDYEQYLDATREAKTARHWREKAASYVGRRNCTALRAIAIAFAEAAERRVSAYADAALWSAVAC
jgi:hypothetical protein